MEQEKLLKDVFKDFTDNSNLLNTKIMSVNLFKKSNKIDIQLKSDEKIELEEIIKFEQYIQNKFSIETATVEMSYSFLIDDNIIKEEWNNIIKYIAIKYPLTKAIMKESTLNIMNNKITIILNVKGKDILMARNMHNVLAELIKHLYNKSYIIEFMENISEEKIHELEDKLKEEEYQVIKKIQNVENQIQKEEQKETKTKETKEAGEEQSPLILGKSTNIKADLIKIANISVDTDKLCLEGDRIGDVESRELKNGKILISFKIYDGSSTMLCKSFVAKEQSKTVESRLKNAKGIKIEGNAKYDPYAKEIGVIANVIIETPGMKKEKRMDNSAEKRVELHIHTKMSQMDGVTSCEDLLKRAVSWGWKAIAITDHGVVQAFPDAHKYLGKSGADLKVIYGVEAYLVPDKESCVAFPQKQDIDTEYCILDIETTGLSFRTEKITEFGIMKYKNGEVIDSFESFVNPEKPIPKEVVDITNITDEMVKDAPTIKEIMPKVLEFIGDSVLVAHNADFDIGFIKYNCKQLGLELNNTYIDTLRLAKDLFPGYKKYKLGIIADNLGIKVEVAHRALDDVDTLVKVFQVMLKILKEKGVKKLEDIDTLEAGKADYKKLPTYHAIILARNLVGLKNLYKLISYSHLDYFYKKPRILKSIFKKHSEGLMLGSACEAGELYRAIVAGKTDEDRKNCK